LWASNGLPASQDSNSRSNPGEAFALELMGRVKQSWHFLVLICICMALVFVLWAHRTQRETVVSPGVIQTVQITATQGMDLFPAFSPDGGVIAYSSLRNGDFDLFVRQLAPGGREIQITSDGGQNLQPAWSPDGKMIAYHSRKRRGIWLLPALGGLSRRLTEFGSKPAWSRDGDWIAYQSDAPADLSQTALGALPPSTIWIISSGGGPPRQVTRTGVPSGGHGVPVWSPDGSRIIFATYDLGLSELWSVCLIKRR
jgi:Tol biopolymer transport system component